MKSILTILAGASYSCAYVAPQEYVGPCLALSAVLVIFMRQLP